jgi:2-C-methyl-D-erythritol 4-phosphate cytidylyltransferase
VGHLENFEVPRLLLVIREDIVEVLFPSFFHLASLLHALREFLAKAFDFVGLETVLPAFQVYPFF